MQIGYPVCWILKEQTFKDVALSAHQAARGVFVVFVDSMTCIRRSMSCSGGWTGSSDGRLRERFLFPNVWSARVKDFWAIAWLLTHHAIVK